MERIVLEDVQTHKRVSFRIHLRKVRFLITSGDTTIHPSARFLLDV